MVGDTILTAPLASTKSYDAFISYSHAADDRFAPLLQRALQRFAKSWRQRRALEVFRDETGLSVDPDLWHGIAQALDAARWFIYLASPDASHSPWVGKEIRRWKETKDVDRILIVLTAGDWSWDAAHQDFDPQRSTAIHPELLGVFGNEPHVLDMRWAHKVERLTLRDSRFRDCVATIAAPLHGRPKDDLEDEDTRSQRRVRRLARSAVLLLSVLLLVALAAGVLAVQQRNEARRQLLVAQARQLAATSETLLGTNLDRALLLAVQAYGMHVDAQTRAALYEASTASPHLVRYYDAGGTVTALRGSADGKVIVAGLEDGRVLTWDSRRAGKAEQVTRLAAPVTQLALTPTADVVAASDGTRLFRSDGGTTPATPDGYEVRALAISPSGRSMAVSLGPRATGIPRTLLAGAGRVQLVPVTQISSYGGWDRLTFSEEDRLVAYNGGTGTWSVVRPGPVPQIESEGNLSFGVHNYASALAAGGDFVTYTNSAAEVPIWPTVPQGDIDRPQLVGHSVGRYPRAMALSADAATLAVADGGTIYVSQTHAPGAPPTEVVELTGNAQIAPDGLDFLGAGGRLVSATGSKLTLWDTHQLSRISTRFVVPVPFGCVACTGPHVALSHDARRVAITPSSGLGDSSVQTLAPRSKPVVVKSDVFATAGPPVWSTTDNRLFLPTTEGDEMQVRDLDHRGRLIDRWPLHLGDSAVVADGVSASGDRLVVVGAAGQVQVRDAHTGEVVSRKSVPMAGSPDASPELVLNQDLTEVAARNGSTVRFTAIDGREQRTLHLAALKDLSLAADRLAGFTSDGRLQMRDSDDGSVIWSGSRTGGYLAGPFLSRAGHLVAAQRQDGLVVVSDGDSGDEVARFQLPASVEALKTSIVFDDTETKVVSVTEGAGDEGQVQVWELSPATWIDRACEAAGDRLTSSEVRSLTGVRGLRIEPCGATAPSQTRDEASR